MAAKSPMSQAPAFDRLVEQFSQLPGIGPRSAQRMAFHLLQRPAADAEALADAVRALKRDLKVCAICANVSEADPCPICADPRRDRATVLVVEQPTDIALIEQLGRYRGVYHVLVGRLAPLDGVGPGDLNIDTLLRRVDKPPRDPDTGDPWPRPNEIIVATNPTLEGDGTALYLDEQLAAANSRVTLTRLARGVPTGANLAAVSKAVLSDALESRQHLHNHPR